MNQPQVSPFGPQGFNADANTNPDSEVVPKGWHVGMFVRVELKASKSDPNSTYLDCDFQITEGPSLNRHVFDMWTFNNANQRAMQIGRGTLSNLCKALGITNLHSPQELIHKRVQGYVGVQTDKSSGEERNRLSRFKPAPTPGTMQQPQPLPANHQQQQAAAAAGQPPAPVQYPVQQPVQQPQQPMQQPVQQPAVQQPAQQPAPAPQPQQQPGPPPADGQPW